MPQSFTSTYPGLTLTPQNKVKISEAFDPKAGGTPPPAFDFDAVWDTGATNTVVTQKVVDTLKLSPVTKRRTYTGSGSILADVYLVNIVLPNNVQMVGVPASCLPITGPDALIGMDIITRGDFAITNKNGVSKMSFQFPSTHDIDFVKNPGPFSSTVPKPGRNDQCPCGSGKKYKNCHGA